ncbi:MAG TPA: 4-hydroxythreonine-4-phosphate dehydrogenase PdxA, partial [Chroococcidiopsis sp.]
MNALSLDLPRLAIALGDPMGIGPEVVLKALADPALATQCAITVVGSRSLLCDRYEALRAMIPADNLAHPETLNMVEIDVPDATATQLRVGHGNAASGAVSFWTLERTIALALAGAVDGVVTAPISKAAWNAAGYHYPGQTELLAEAAHSQRFGMLFVARSPHTGWTLRTLLATTHIPLRQVPDALTPALMTLKLELLVECLRQDFGLERPTIAIAGLNPHSGEQGQLGREELDWLIPWMQEMGDRLPQVRLEGPVPPDTLWV